MANLLAALPNKTADGGDIAFWGTGTLDIGDMWDQANKDAGLNVAFIYNGNDSGSIFACLV
ncbi:MAG: hypothetical protein COB24_05635 [Hyphomicrobiales bacterium]|nr:MAG: hypothetical protein COB24_05635 [Hyphomicrobiales bacterium]